MKTLDDIAITNRGYKIFDKKARQSPYLQKMQSRYGGRQFTLKTICHDDGTAKITLFERDNVIATRTARTLDIDDIEAAIKSLERKAGCKLYYILLISTDGEYL